LQRECKATPIDSKRSLRLSLNKKKKETDERKKEDSYLVRRVPSPHGVDVACHYEGIKITCDRGVREVYGSVESVGKGILEYCSELFVFL